jgi:hypothetical protein
VIAARSATLCLIVVAGALGGGCATRHPAQERVLRTYMAADPAYAVLPPGAPRVDALYMHARQLTGSDAGAIELLGDLAVREGAQLRHPFNTGLAADGPLADHDRTGHFFAAALWTWEDAQRLVPLADSNAFWWEVLGELKSWVSSGAGFDPIDLWAHALGCEFARRVRAAGGRAFILPGAVLSQPEHWRPASARPALQAR